MPSPTPSDQPRTGPLFWSAPGRTLAVIPALPASAFMVLGTSCAYTRRNRRGQGARGEGRLSSELDWGRALPLPQELRAPTAWTPLRRGEGDAGKVIRARSPENLERRGAHRRVHREAGPELTWAGASRLQLTAYTTPGSGVSAPLRKRGQRKPSC